MAEVRLNKNTDVNKTNWVAGVKGWAKEQFLRTAGIPIDNEGGSCITWARLEHQQ